MNRPRHPQDRRRPDQRGAATLVAVTVTGLLLCVGMTLSVVGALFHTHRVAQAAADLAAIAGAEARARNDDACAAASMIAARNGARMASCSVDGLTVSVEVTAAGPRWLGRQDHLPARARAGPAQPEAG